MDNIVRIKSFFVVLCVTALCITVLLSGCGVSDSPDKTAKQFWQAMADNNLEKARSLATADSVDRVSLQNGKVIDNISFADDIKFDESDKNRASISTEMDIYYSDEVQEPFHLSFNTGLVKEQDLWKVDFDNTLGSMVSSTIIELGSELKNSLQQAGEAAVELTNEAMLKAMIEMTDALQNAAEQMHEAAQQMKETREQEETNKQPEDQHTEPSAEQQESAGPITI